MHMQILLPMPGVVPPPRDHVSRGLFANLAINSENAIEWAESYLAKMRLPARAGAEHCGRGKPVLGGC